MIEIRSQKSAAVVGPPMVGRNYGGPRNSGVRIKELSKPLNVEMTASLSVKLFDTQFSNTLK